MGRRRSGDAGNRPHWLPPRCRASCPPSRRCSAPSPPPAPPPSSGSRDERALPPAVQVHGVDVGIGGVRVQQAYIRVRFRPPDSPQGSQSSATAVTKRAGNSMGVAPTPPRTPTGTYSSSSEPDSTSWLALPEWHVMPSCPTPSRSPSKEKQRYPSRAADNSKHRWEQREPTQATPAAGRPAACSAASRNDHCLRRL